LNELEFGLKRINAHWPAVKP